MEENKEGRKAHLPNTHTRLDRIAKLLSLGKGLPIGYRAGRTADYVILRMES